MANRPHNLAPSAVEGAGLQRGLKHSAELPWWRHYNTGSCITAGFAEASSPVSGAGLQRGRKKNSAERPWQRHYSTSSCTTAGFACVAVRGYDRVLSHGISSTGTRLMLASMYVDDILLVVSAQVAHLLPAGNPRPTQLALHDLGGIPGQCDTRWPPQFVDLRASTSILYSAPVGVSYLGTTLDNTPVWLSEVVTECCHTASAALGLHYCSRQGPGGSPGGVAWTVVARQGRDSDTQGLTRRAVKRGQAGMHPRANECWHAPSLK